MGQVDKPFETYEVYGMTTDCADQEYGFSIGPYQRVKDES